MKQMQRMDCKQSKKPSTSLAKTKHIAATNKTLK
jgi:hypothetical protein